MRRNIVRKCKAAYCYCILHGSWICSIL